MKTDHTPGPWYYTYGAVWTTPNGPDDGGQCVAMRASAATLEPTVKDANLRAIAALPDLLAALQAAVRALSAAQIAGESLYKAPVTQAARAAIEKATNGT